MSDLVDGFGRAVRKLRVSVTDRCNFRCAYCLPTEPVWLPRKELLSFEEIEAVVSSLAEQGVSKVRLTGGEPLLRRDIERLVAQLAAIPGIDTLSMTTNGYHLPEKAKALREAGLGSVTVSLDAIDAKTFEEVVKRPAFEKVMAGIVAASEAGFDPIKINCVRMRGMSDDQLLGFAELARSGPYVVRFIEFMPLDSGGTWDMSKVETSEETRRRIHQTWPLEAVESNPSDPARLWRFADGKGTIGFISSVSEPFCGSCDRIRITADGKILNCLFSHDEFDLREVLRAGGGKREILDVVRRAVGEKKAGHLINRPGFEPPPRSMVAIGG